MNIAFFSSEKNNIPPYLKSLQKANFVLIGQEDEEILLNERIHAFVLDFSDQKTENILAYLCGVVIDIRKSQRVPLFIILEQTKQIDRELLLQLGVTGVFDHYTDPSEFSLAVSNILTADYIEEQEQEMSEQTKMLQLIPENLAVRTEKNQEVQLTRLEYKLLDYLNHTKEKAANYEELIAAIWGNNITNGHTRISNIVFHVRKKIERNPSIPKYLKTIHGKGYRLDLRE